MRFYAILVLLALAVCSGCVVDVGSKQSAPAGSPKSAGAGETAGTEAKAAGETRPTKTAVAPVEAKNQCAGIPTENRKIDAKQTFPIEFEPFRGSCFVTLHDADYTNPPLNSEFFVYRGGKQVYRFPNQFNGVTVGCWIEAVSFQDLNEDGLTDIIVAGMCSAKSRPYSENMVYVNRGGDFTTSEEANYELQKFTKIKDIADFVRKNEKIFFQ